MSSEYAEFLFSFAWNKLESSPQLDLRQQLLHSNLIRQILLVHQQSNSATSSQATSTTNTAPNSTTLSSTSTTLTSSSPSSPSSSSEDQSQLLCLPPLPPSPPLSPVPQSRQQSHLYVFSASPNFGHQNSNYQNFSQYPDSTILGQIPSAWTPYSYNDEFDRIGSRQSPEFQDLDVDMEEDSSDTSFYPHNQNNYSSDFQQFGFNSYLPEQPSFMEGADLDYDLESSQAQEDWLDAVLEDLMEEDDQDDSTVEYDSDDDEDHDSFRDKELDINVTLGPSSQAVVVVTHNNQEGGFLGHLLDQNGQRLIQNHYQQHSHPIPSVPCPSLLDIDLYNSSHESPFPYHKSYLHQSFQTKEKGSTAAMSTMISTSPTTTSTTTTTTASKSSVTNSSDLPFVTSAPRTGVTIEESSLPQDHVSLLKQNNKMSSFFMDDAYYRACPPSLGFHSSSRSYSKKGQSEDALREQRFVQLTQELGAVMVKEQEVDALPERQQSFGDSFMFRSSAISPAGGTNGFLAFGH